MGMVWDLDNAIIDREEKYILLAYADHADHKGYNIFPAISTICQKTGYKERAAQMITKSLADKGFLAADGKGVRGTNKWRIPLDKDGVRIAPAKNAPPQNIVDWGADGRGEGVQQDAPEPSEAPEPSNDIYESIINVLRPISSGIFGNDWQKWRAFEKVVRRAQVSIQDETLILSGYGMEAAMYDERYSRSFNNVLRASSDGFTSLTFQE